jgi:hypothetical protein
LDNNVRTMRKEVKVPALSQKNATRTGHPRELR